MGLFNFLGEKLQNTEFKKHSITVTSDIVDNILIREMAIYIATSFISDTISKCECKVYENGEEVQNELYYKLNISPNPNQNSTQLFTKIVTNLLTKGNCVVIPYRNDFYCCDGYSKEENVFKDDIFSCFSVGNQTLNKNIKASDLLYFTMSGKNPKQLIDGLYDQYSRLVAYSIQDYIDTNSIKYKFELDNYASGSREFQEKLNDMLQHDIKKYIQSDVGILPIYKGTNLTRLENTHSGSDNKISNILNLRKEIFSMIAQTYKIPIELLLNEKTDNINELIKLYITFCINPICNMISEEITRKTNTYVSWKKGNYVKIDTSNITYMDMLDVSTAVDKLIASGVCNIDELRSRLGLNALNTDFSTQYYMTKNYSTIENLDNVNNSF